MTPGKGKATSDSPTAGEYPPRDIDAQLAAFSQIIDRAAQQFRNPLAGIASASIALRDPNANDTATDQHINVHIYTPSNGGNSSENFQRLEGYLHNLQPDEKDEFVRVVDRIRGDSGQRAKDGGHNFQKLLAERKELLIERDALLSERETRVAELARQSKQQDADSEEDEAKRSRLESLRHKLEEKTQLLKGQRTLDKVLKEEVAGWRQRDTIASSAAQDNCSSAKGSKSPKNPMRPAKPSKPPQSMSPFTPMPEHIDKGKAAKKGDESKPAKQSTQGTQSSKSPNHSTNGKAAKSESKLKPTVGPPKNVEDPSQKKFGGIWGGKFDEETGPPKTPKKAWSNIDPDKAWKKDRKTSNADKKPEPQGAVVAAMLGSTRRQSRAAAKAAQPATDNVNEADDESATDVLDQRKDIPKKKRKAESSDEEEQPKTSKKSRQRASILKPVEEEPDGEDKHSHAARSSSRPSGPNAKLSRAQQGAKSKAAQADSDESGGGMLDPMCISSAEDTDSDTDDEY